ncbi:DEAD/DEAH box helicase [Marinigracilibium pacificum]|uniref:DEAD/DEAH box helicase n=1 Tax=Marinigracilibium pacificum TaxID=2729599 RepID=A0A848IX72_9BACT|nr:DEAD/DEAH box helicase [Marinigracilibium pacificum]NMM46854.1 DEAD/DEAH box helicase [Marinigracilibium pacificum]
MSKEITSFEDFKLNKQILNAVEEAGYITPTPIQQKAIPLISAGHDVLGIAQTGTGKTAAYLLPILMKLKYAQGKDPRAVILAPTRELVLQIEEEARKFSEYLDIRIVSFYGGLGPKTQIELAEQGVDLIISTPQRFMDIYRKEAFITKQIKTMVMDEADKMMDMGFFHQILRLLEILPQKKQNLLFSATFPEKVEKLSEEFLEFPERVEIDPQATTAETIEQELYKVPNFKTKVNLLTLLLKDENLSRVIVFVKTKRTADNIFKYLERTIEGGVRVIHANKGQNSRINAMNDFKEGEIRVLVSTDVTARGMDISMVSHVINFDVPIIYEDYVHRIGRTGRAMKSGTAITFENPAENYHIKKIEEIIRMTIPVKDLPEDLEVTETPKEEKQNILKAIDFQRKKEDPNFKGAFHDKKPKSEKKKFKAKNQNKGKSRRR